MLKFCFVVTTMFKQSGQSMLELELSVTILQLIPKQSTNRPPVNSLYFGRNIERSCIYGHIICLYIVHLVSLYDQKQYACLIRLLIKIPLASFLT